MTKIHQSLKLIILGIIITVLAAQTTALQIIAVDYDPQGADQNKEWVQIYNPQNNSISLDNLVLESGNGGQQGDWTIEWRGNGTLAPHQAIIVGETNFSTYIEALDLQNGPDAIRLRVNDDIIDTVGWGEHAFDEYYETIPAQDRGDGWGLQRICTFSLHEWWQCKDTDNNNEDFVTTQNTTAFYFSRAQPDKIDILLPESEPTLVNITIEDDATDIAGIQWLPSDLPTNKQITYAIADATASNYTVTARLLHNASIRSQANITTDCTQNCQLHLTLPAYPQEGQWQLRITLDNQTNRTETFSITVLPSVGVDVKYHWNPQVQNNLWFLGTVTLTNPTSQAIELHVGLASQNQTLFGSLQLNNQTLLHGKSQHMVLQANEERILPLLLQRNSVAIVPGTRFVGHLWIDTAR